MPRYIDADALIADLEKAMLLARTNEEIADLKLCKEIVRTAPTISPDEVRGVGKWIKRKKVRKNLPADSDYLYSCSVCGCGDEHNENVSVPFCWHCGAKMEVSEDA